MVLAPVGYYIPRAGGMGKIQKYSLGNVLAMMVGQGAEG
jgi:hypothetical protein